SGAATNELRLYLNHGDGTFGAPQIYSTIAFGRALVLADYDGDGRVDVGVVGSGSENLGLLAIVQGTATGTLVATPYFGDVLGAGRQWFSGVVGDFDHSGTPDLVAQSTVGRTWAAQLAAANGSLTAEAAITASGTVFAAGDFDRDGTLDLLFGGNG